MRRLPAVCVVALLATWPTITGADDDVAPSFDELIRLLKLDPSVKQRVLAGEIVMLDRDDSMKKELASALVMAFRRPYGEIIDAVKGNRLFQYHEFMLDFAQIEGTPDVSKFQEVGYTAAEADEVRALLAAGPGDEFNLSSAEIVQFRHLQAAAGGLDDAALIETVNNALRRFLAERLRRYQETGLHGIPTYQRSDTDTSSPAEELNAATLAMTDFKWFAPHFYSILQNFPDAPVRRVEHRFYVFKYNIAGRPGFILSHRIYFFSAEFALIAARHIYAPHFYNSMQHVAGAIPYQDSTVLFYANRYYTDRVTGFGSGFKHAMGGERLENRIKAWLSDIRAGVEHGKVNRVRQTASEPGHR
jgi:hypothetical protein